ncbi:MAG: cupin domain-containing protein [Agarilytica sp.]
MRVFILMMVLVVVAGCQTLPKAQKVVFPEQQIDAIVWTEEEKQKDFAIRSLYKGGSSSAVLMLMNANEPPHYHDYHDLSATIISGHAAINYKDRKIELHPGDAIFIPKGTYHWAERLSDGPVVVFAVFSPAFDGTDRRMADEE